MAEIELSKMLVALRQELWESQQEAQDKDIKFVVNDVELELQLTMAKKENDEFGVKFYIFNSKTKDEILLQSVQKIKLKLTPETADGEDLKLSRKIKKP